MAIDLYGYRIFLSSPSGLDSERDAFYRTVLEVNEIDAEARARTFIPVGWEREPVGWGRPQSRLNDRLKECDYLILLLADRWGTPTGADEDGFSSGTEEEYSVARECLLGEDPMRDIVVLFKGVPERQLVDPGHQLRKVLSFKAALEREKSLLFATFDDEADLSRILRRHLLRWLRDDDEPLSAGDARKGNPPPPSISDDGVDGQSQSSGPMNGESPLDEAKELARSGEKAKAEGRFAEAVSEDADDLEARFQYAKFLRQAGRFTHAIEVSKGLISLAKSRGEDRWVIEGLGNLGISLRREGHLEDSRASLVEAIALAGQDDAYLATLAYLENNLGLTLRRTGEIGQAESHYNRALRIYEQLGDDDGLSYAHINLSYVIRDQGDLPQARKHAQAVIDLKSSSKRCVAMAHCNLGLIDEEENELNSAEECFTLALRLNVELDNAAGQAMNYAHLARVKLERGDKSGALKDGGHALDLNEWSGNSEGTAMSLHVIGQIEILQRKYPVAESRLKDARDIYQALGHRIGLAGTRADLAILLARTRRLADAELALGEAQSDAKGIEHVGLQTRLARAAEEVAKVTDEISDGNSA